MKRKIFPLLAFLSFAVLPVTESCKSKKNQPVQKESTKTDESPVIINNDEQLRSSVKNVVNDYADVKAEVNDGVVTLTGTVKQDELQKLIMKVQELRPRKVENRLTIK